MDSNSVSSQATCRIETETNPSPRDVFSEHHDYEMFLLQKEIDAPHVNLNHHVPHAGEEKDQDTILTHTTITANEIHPKYTLNKKYRVQIVCTLNKIY